MKITLPDETEYNISLEDLLPRTHYKASSNTIVVTNSDCEPINIANGVGAYSRHVTFKKLPDGTKIEFTVGEEG